MKTLAVILGIALLQTPLLAASASAAGSNAHPKPPANYQGQWYTTPGGCSYSRAQAPGYPVTWHLILNPHHIGKPAAKPSCPHSL